MRSGTTRRDVISMELFERTWRRSKRWAMVVTTPDQIPVTAQQLPFLRTVLAFEQAGDWRVASQAYAAAWRQWPDSEGAGMGVGNSAFAEGDFVAAATAYRRLLTLHPDFAPAMNNLALSLAKQGDWSAGEHYARAAVAAGGAQRQTYQETLQQIRDHIAK
jgi:Flp pilus assembly protein TadD